MAKSVHIEKFMALSAMYPLVDVRSPSEFRQGHIPGAVNIPLFDDRERKVVGTAYKQVNREAAMFAGLEFAGKKLVSLAKEGLRAAGRGKTLLVHCWRGGMRSRSMGWLFETMGLTCYLLEEGYKAYRRYLREELGKPLNLAVLGGRTGSGKTLILGDLANRGEQVVDLEALACHKGSAFGALGEREQPTTEQFENDLLQAILGTDRERITWIEDESRNIGKCVIPMEIYSQMKEGRIFFLDIPREARAAHLVTHYASYGPGPLKECIRKISRRLGGDRTREAVEAVERGDYHATAMITLGYYDKTYMHSLHKNHPAYSVVSSDAVNTCANAELLINHVRSGKIQERY